MQRVSHSLLRRRRNRSIVALIACCLATFTSLATSPVPASAGSDVDARVAGSGAPMALNRPIVGIAVTPSGNGYWLVADDGGIFAFGDAEFFGSAGAIKLNRPIVGIAVTPSGNGYWLVADDGGIFAFGDAEFRGSTGAIKLNRGIVGMASTPSGNGYWLVADDGGIFAFGDAKFRGSTGAIKLAQPIVGMASTPSGNGYWLVAGDGGIFAFGDAKFFGSAGGGCLTGKVVGMASQSNVRGYWIVSATANIKAYATQATAATSGCSAPGATTTPVTAAGPPAPAGPSTAEVAIAKDMFDRLNAERAARKLPTLRWDDQLAVHARGWSSEMAKSGAFRHSDLNPLLVRFSTAAENIAYGRGAGITSGVIHSAWMQSDGHRANILAPNLDVVGIGVMCTPDGTLWATQQYGRFPDSSRPSGFGPQPPTYPLVRTDPGTVAC